MNASVFVVLFAVAYGVSADCGCLKCSKDLTVGGYSIPVPGCGPVQIIYRDVPGCLPERQLPVTIQVPVPATPVETEVVAGVAEDLTYEVLPPAVTEIVEPGFCGDYRFPGPLLPPFPLGRTCLDKVVLPGPPLVEETIVTGPGYAGGALISEGFGPLYNRGWLNRGCGPYFNRDIDILGPGYNREIDIVGPGYGREIDIVGPGYGREIDIVTPGLGPALLPPLVGPVVEQIVEPACNPCRPPVLLRRPTCGPALDVISNRCETKKCLFRYRNDLIPIVQTSFMLTLNDENIYKPTMSNVNISNHCTASANNSNAKAKDGDDRRKREVPFLKHGYKFLMNMLPEFVKEPIENTVNILALTHPDEKLRKLYNQPKKLSLGEKILLRNKKNMNLLKRKLFGHHLKKNTIKKPVDDYLIEKEARTFSSKLNEPIEYSEYPWMSEINSRFLNTEENLNSELIPTRLNFDKDLFTSKFTNPKDEHQFTETEKALFLKKLKILNENEEGRIKRSTFFQNYMKGFSQDPQNHVILSSSELALPFYQVKLEDSSEGTEYGEYYYDDDDGEAASREQMLRNVIRKELLKYKYDQTDVGESAAEPFNLNNIIPHSPLLHLISLPMKFLLNFDKLRKQAFPVVSSLPKMITTSKKYFKDFGKNFKRNVLDLASDVIGDFDNLDSENNLLAMIVGPLRGKRSIHQTNEDENTDARDELLREENKLEQYEPDYSLVFLYDTNENSPNLLDAKVRKKRYILKMVDEEEVEDFLVEKLSEYLTRTEESYPRRDRLKAQSINSEDVCPMCQKLRRQMTAKSSEESYGEKKVVLEQLKPKIIIDNNGLPFLELDGYKKPMLKSLRKNKRKQDKTQDSFESSQNPYYYSGEVDSDRIGYIIDHAKNHVASSHNERFSEMPVKIVKEKISKLLLETDLLVHMDFDKYDEIYDNLIALQHIKSTAEQDWKRLIISKKIDDMNAKICLLGKFQEMQHFKDMTLRGVAYALYEEHENKFVTRKLLKILVRLQKLQCIINQVVENVQAKLHMGSKLDTRKEIKYVDFFAGLNFVNAKTRNEMISNLMKDRDLALQQNIELLDQLKRLLVFETDSEKLNEEASLLWEMRNIEKLQRSTIEDMNQNLIDGYKIKKELKILFDLLKRHESCEMEQRKLLSQFEEESSSEEFSVEYSEEDVNTTRNKKEISKKFDVEEFRSRLQERLRKRKILLKKKLKNNRMNRKSQTESYDSDEDD